VTSERDLLSQKLAAHHAEPALLESYRRIIEELQAAPRAGENSETAPARKTGVG
jgi:hypothetical protein